MEDVLTQKIGNYIKMVSIAIFAILSIYVMYDNHNSKQQLRQSQKTADSLEALIEKYKYDYIELKNRADELDSLIKSKTDNLTEVKSSFGRRKKSPPKTPNESYNFVKKFLGE